RSRGALSQKNAPPGRFGEADGSGAGGSGNQGQRGKGVGQGDGLGGGFALGGSSGHGSPAAGGGPGAFGAEYPSSGNMGSSMGQPGGGPAGGFAAQSSPGGPGGVSGGPMGAGSFGPTSPSTADASNTGGGFSATRQWVAGLPNPGTDQTAAAAEPASRQAGQRRRPGEWYDPPPKTPSGLESPAESTTQNPVGQNKSSVSARQLRSLRGRNWALPEATDKAIPITRPIPVQCYSDRLVIGPDGERRKEIPLGAQSLESVDELVGAIWEQVESWGIAGRGMYWRPVLSVQVAPGAEGRFQELQTLLEDSGVLVERRR
ncbi:MAG TPA: hypothetical protein PLQ00_04055, partial [Thermoguttaceae bacterium]|nr:hypothetical protein [Thermoguttaceae bacterium]